MRRSSTESGHPRRTRRVKGGTSHVDAWIQDALSEDPPKSKSLIATIFGDAIAPHGPWIWLGDLIELLVPFGVNERLVRTSAFRLTEEGWLQTVREGRRSRYSLTVSGVRRFDYAFQRIYHPPPSDWEGVWTMVVLPRRGISPAERTALRRELGWEGFGVLAPGILLHPSATRKTLEEILAEHSLTKRVVVFRARDAEDLARRPVHALVPDCWNLDGVISDYQRFLDRFIRLAEAIDSSLTPLQAFLVRTLLIHSFRRVGLHDPHLPAAILPVGWPGHAAYELCRKLYLSAYSLAEAHLAQQLRAPGSTFPEIRPEFRTRFGELP